MKIYKKPNGHTCIESSKGEFTCIPLHGIAFCSNMGLQTSFLDAFQYYENIDSYATMQCKGNFTDKEMTMIILATSLAYATR